MLSSLEGPPKRALGPGDTRQAICTESRVHAELGILEADNISDTRKGVLGPLATFRRKGSARPLRQNRRPLKHTPGNVRQSLTIDGQPSRHSPRGTSVTLDFPYSGKPAITTIGSWLAGSVGSVEPLSPGGPQQISSFYGSSARVRRDLARKCQPWNRGFSPGAEEWAAVAGHGYSDRGKGRGRGSGAPCPYDRGSRERGREGSSRGGNRYRLLGADGRSRGFGGR